MNKIFLEKVAFICLHANIMKAIDLNHSISALESENSVNIFTDATVFNPEEVRQYLFVIVPKDLNYKINRFEVVRNFKMSI